MDNRLIIRPDAESEILEAYNWHEGQEEGLGARFRDAVNSCIALIIGYPGSSPIVFKDARRAIVNHLPYCLYYRVRSDLITVLSCFHTSRDPSGWQRRIEESIK